MTVLHLARRLSVIAIVGYALVASGWLWMLVTYTRHQEWQLALAWQEAGRYQTTLLAQHLDRSFKSGNMDEVQRAVNRLAVVGGRVTVVLLAADGAVLAETAGASLAPPAALGPLGRRSIATERLEWAQGDVPYRVHYALRLTDTLGRPAAALLTTLDWEPSYRDSQKSGALLLTQHTLMAGVLLIVLITGAAQLLVSPLRAMALRARAISAGDRPAAAPPPLFVAELADLAEASAQMLAALSAREAELRALNDSLEAVVAQRTAALAASEEKLRVLFAILPAGVAIVDRDNQVVEANPALARILDLPPDAVAGDPAARRLYTQHDGAPLGAEQFPSRQAIAEGREVHDVELGVPTRRGDTTWASLSAAPLPIPGLGAALVAVDITTRKRAQLQLADQMARVAAYSQQLEQKQDELRDMNMRLQRLANTDGLTGLLNHRAFQERLAQEQRRAGSGGHPLALILLDVDRFKQFNDQFGHPAGDLVLRTVAALLQGHARETDTVARYGGEEFVVILPHTDAEGAVEAAERLRRVIAGHSWALTPITASFGVAATGPAMGAQDLVAAADMALYRAKQVGRNCVCRGDSAGPAPAEEANA